MDRAKEYNANLDLFAIGLEFFRAKQYLHAYAGLQDLLRSAEALLKNKRRFCLRVVCRP